MDRLPAWTGPDGFPLSWSHYVYGQEYLTRATARGLLEAATANRVGVNADQQGYRQWRRELLQETR